MGAFAERMEADEDESALAPLVTNTMDLAGAIIGADSIVAVVTARGRVATVAMTRGDADPRRAFRKARRSIADALMDPNPVIDTDRHAEAPGALLAHAVADAPTAKPGASGTPRGTETGRRAEITAGSEVERIPKGIGGGEPPMRVAEMSVCGGYALCRWTECGKPCERWISADYLRIAPPASAPEPIGAVMARLGGVFVSRISGLRPSTYFVATQTKREAGDPTGEGPTEDDAIRDLDRKLSTLALAAGGEAPSMGAGCGARDARPVLGHVAWVPLTGDERDVLNGNLGQEPRAALLLSLGLPADADAIRETWDDVRLCWMVAVESRSKSLPAVLVGDEVPTHRRGGR